MVVWFTGMSGSGKSTLCAALRDALLKKHYSVTWIDGDQVRKSVRREGDFSREAIFQNNAEVIDKCKSLAETNDFVLVSLIAPFRETRDLARRTLGQKYLEIYLKCDVQTLVARDTKGLYGKALAGELDNLVGYSEKLPYEVPCDADLTIDTASDSPKQSLLKVKSLLKLENGE